MTTDAGVHDDDTRIFVLGTSKKKKKSMCFQIEKGERMKWKGHKS